MKRRQYHYFPRPTRRYLALLLILLMLGAQAAGAQSPKWSLSKNDLQLAKDADRDAARERWKNAIELGAKAKEPLLEDIFLWRMFIAGSKLTTFKDITAFIRKHPHWPRKEFMLQRAEEAITPDVPAADLIAWFRDESAGKDYYHFREPVTAKGKHVLGSAMALQKNALKAREEDINRLIREAWIDSDFTLANENVFLKLHKDRLRQEDHLKRANRLTWDNQLIAAKRMLPRLKKEQQLLFDARIKLRENSFGIDRAVDKVPRKLMYDDGLLYDRIRWREKRKTTADMNELIKHIPAEKSDPKRMWGMLQKYIYALFRKGNYALAYKLASEHGFKDDPAGLAEAEWLAGWIALRFQNKPRVAYKHFYKMFHVVKTPISLGRAAYWAGRASEVNSNPDIAQKWYNVAARYPTSFYGQLSTLKLGKNELTFQSVPKPDANDMAAFEKNDLVHAAYILGLVRQHGLARLFVTTAAKNATSPGQQQLVAQFGLKVARPDYSIASAQEVSYNNGPLLLDALYPRLKDLKNIKGGKITAPEAALVHAITRQESLFNQYARSHAGALGLMQLMPGTAQEVARKLKVKYDKNRLTSDPTYNVTFGSFYLNERVEQFNGAYIMAIAAYNGGARNVNKWLEQNGNPQEMKSLEDIVDWIEHIPFSETRNYVQRVLENLQIYRYVLGVHNRPVLKLADDLKR